MSQTTCAVNLWFFTATEWSWSDFSTFRARGRCASDSTTSSVCKTAACSRASPFTSPSGMTHEDVLASHRCLPYSLIKFLSVPRMRHRPRAPQRQIKVVAGNWEPQSRPAPSSCWTSSQPSMFTFLVTTVSCCCRCTAGRSSGASCGR